MSAGDNEVWLDDDAGPLIRPYTVNEGRTRPTVLLDMLSVVIAIGDSTPGMDPEHVQALKLCHAPLSVAEVAAYVRLPLAVTKVLIADLVDQGALAVRAPSSLPDAVDRELLEKLLDGLQQI